MILGFWWLNSSIDIEVTFEFGHAIMILKMAIFDKLDDIGIEPELMGSSFYFMLSTEWLELAHTYFAVLATRPWF